MTKRLTLNDVRRSTALILSGASMKRFVFTLMAAIPVVMIPALEWLPGIPGRLRPWLILAGLVIAAIGLVVVGVGEKRAEDLSRENAELRTSIAKAEPEYLIHEIGRTLFGQGAWRLTVYKKSQSQDAHVGDYLGALISVASDGDQANTRDHRILVRPSTMFELSFRNNLADPRYRVPAESGAGPEEVYSDAWLTWRDEIFGAGAVIGDLSTFRARKFAWYAAQDGKNQSVFVVLAESAEPEGIMVDRLDHSFTPAWLFFGSQVAELRSSTAEIAV